jgi:hypothetical protein
MSLLRFGMPTLAMGLGAVRKIKLEKNSNQSDLVLIIYLIYFQLKRNRKLELS